MLASNALDHGMKVIRISFNQISEVVEYLMNTYSFSELRSLEAVEEADLRARSISEARVCKIQS